MGTSVSVAMTTYEGDSASALQECLTSLRNQEKTPDEVVIVRDKDLPLKLVNIISKFNKQSTCIVRDIPVVEQGRGRARQLGIEKATSDLVAIIDADDIACPHRLKRQVDYFEKNPSVDVVGGYIGEFENTSQKIESVREVPLKTEDIRKTAHYRSPVNHPTVMFRREVIIDVGNYKRMEYGEDYELWCRLLSESKNIENIPEVLVKVRADELIQRRRGLKIAYREMRLQRAIVQTGFYGWDTALRNLAIRIPIRLLPKKILKYIYKSVLRS